MRFARYVLLILSIFCAASLSAQKQVTIVSFYLDREVDFSLMQAFNDDSEKKIKTLMEDPEFNLDNTISNFHEFIVNEIMPKAPFQVVDESQVTSSSSYQSLSALVDLDKSKLHEPAKGYLRLGFDFQNEFLQVANEHGANGVLLVNLKFFVRKNMLKTVIMAQVEMTLRNIEGKSAYKYQEFGLSQEGINTFSGFVISRQDEVLPMFNEAIDNLKEKMLSNFEKRSLSAAKKL